jgi:hypothetical protein
MRGDFHNSTSKESRYLSLCNTFQIRLPPNITQTRSPQRFCKRWLAGCVKTKALSGLYQIVGRRSK